MKQDLLLYYRKVTHSRVRRLIAICVITLFVCSCGGSGSGDTDLTGSPDNAPPIEDLSALDPEFKWIPDGDSGEIARYDAPDNRLFSMAFSNGTLFTFYRDWAKNTTQKVEITNPTQPSVTYYLSAESGRSLIKNVQIGSDLLSLDHNGSEITSLTLHSEDTVLHESLVESANAEVKTSHPLPLALRNTNEPFAENIEFFNQNFSLTLEACGQDDLDFNNATLRGSFTQPNKPALELAVDYIDGRFSNSIPIWSVAGRTPREVWDDACRAENNSGFCTDPLQTLLGEGAISALRQPFQRVLGALSNSHFFICELLRTENICQYEGDIDGSLFTLAESFFVPNSPVQFTGNVTFGASVTEVSSSFVPQIVTSSRTWRLKDGNPLDVSDGSLPSIESIGLEDSLIKVAGVCWHKDIGLTVKKRDEPLTEENECSVMGGPNDTNFDDFSPGIVDEPGLSIFDLATRQYVFEAEIDEPYSGRVLRNAFAQIGGELALRKEASAVLGVDSENGPPQGQANCNECVGACCAPSSNTPLNLGGLLARETFPGGPSCCGSGGSCSGETWGDPHLVTLDKLKYDFQVVGEFVLAKSLSDNGFEVQVRQEPLGRSTKLSINTAVAMNVDSDLVSVYANGSDGRLVINGSDIDITSLTVFDLPQGGAITRLNNLFQIDWENGSQVRVAVKRNHINVSVEPNHFADLTGLLGNFDNDPSNDLQGESVSNVEPTMSVLPDYLYSEYADTFRISNQTSLFSYQDNENTESFTDLDFPYAIAKLTDLTQTQISEARTICESNGIANPNFLESCIYDVGFSGDETFAQPDLLLTAPLVSVELSEDSENATVPDNGVEFSTPILGRIESESMWLETEIEANDFTSGFSVSENYLAYGAGDQIAIVDLDNLSMGPIKLAPSEFLTPSSHNIRQISLDGANGIVTFQGRNFQDGGIAFLRRSDSSNNWQITQVLKPEEGANGFEFGVNVALQGNTAYASNVSETVNGVQNTGAVYVYERSVAGEWQNTQKISLTDEDLVAGRRFGAAIALDQDILVIGDDCTRISSCTNALGVSASFVHLYQRNINSLWSKVNEIRSTATSTGFGSSGLAISENTIAVGAPWEQDFLGNVYIYEYGDSIRLSQRIESTIERPAFNSRVSFGQRLELENNTLAVKGGEIQTIGLLKPNSSNDFELTTSISFDNAQTGSNIDLSGNRVVVMYSRDESTKLLIYTLLEQ